MPAIAPTITDVSPSGDGSAFIASWGPCAAGDTCNPVSFPKHNDVSFQVAGTISGSTFTLQGSNDGTNYIGLRDPTSTTISFTAADIKAVLEHTRYVKPVITGGTASAITITMLFYFGNPNRT